MAFLAPYPPELRQVEYIQLYFYLKFVDCFDLPPLALLQLRRELLIAGRNLQEKVDEDLSSLQGLIDPPLATDPVIRRQAQKPAPSFVMTPDLSIQGAIRPQQTMILPVLFLGAGIHQLGIFVELIKELGTLGIYCNTGRFVLDKIEAADPSGQRIAVDFSDAFGQPAAVPVSDLSWWLERQPLMSDSILLEFVSPLRVMSKGKPLFRAGFAELFPFLLRRVTGMIASHAGVDQICQPAAFVEEACQVTVRSNSLRWYDWRQLEGDMGVQGVGGLVGGLELSGRHLCALLWVIQVCSLMNCGKGAAFGGGQFRICAA